jgi:hypothetical protein
MSGLLPSLGTRISYQTNILGEDGVLFGKNLRVRIDSFPENTVFDGFLPLSTVEASLHSIYTEICCRNSRLSGKVNIS